MYAITYMIFSFVLLWGRSVPRQGEGIVTVASALAYFGVGMVLLCGYRRSWRRGSGWCRRLSSLDCS